MDTHIQADNVNGIYWLLFTAAAALWCMYLLHSHADNLRYKFVSNKNNYNGRKQINQCEYAAYNNQFGMVVPKDRMKQPKRQDTICDNQIRKCHTSIWRHGVRSVKEKHKQSTIIRKWNDAKRRKKKNFTSWARDDVRARDLQTANAKGDKY